MRLLLRLFFLVVMLASSAGADEGERILTGPAFSDPDKVMKKSEGWKQEPILYDPWAREADLAVTLDQHLYPALLPVAQRFAQERGLKVAVQEGTCGVSQGLLHRKRVDVAGFCCPPAATDRLPDLAYHTLSITPLAILVHPDNPVENLSSDEVRRIFQGVISHWSSVSPGPGGKSLDRPIWPLARLHCKIRPGHWRLILDNEDLFTPRLNETGSIPTMIQRAAKYPDAIGYESVWDAEHYAPTLGRAKAIFIDGADPRDEAALIEGRYPFYRTHSLAIWTSSKTANAHALALVDYIRDQLDEVAKEYRLIAASRLKAAGWRFKGDELIGGPP